jgi:hypothetical protein
VAYTPHEFAARIKLEMEKWGNVVRDANLRIELPAERHVCGEFALGLGCVKTQRRCDGVE